MAPFTRLHGRYDLAWTAEAGASECTPSADLPDQAQAQICMPVKQGRLVMNSSSACTAARQNGSASSLTAVCADQVLEMVREQPWFDRYSYEAKHMAHA